jgi:hypothetical protein
MNHYYKQTFGFQIFIFIFFNFTHHLLPLAISWSSLLPARKCPPPLLHEPSCCVCDQSLFKRRQNKNQGTFIHEKRRDEKTLLPFHITFEHPFKSRIRNQHKCPLNHKMHESSETEKGRMASLVQDGRPSISLSLFPISWRLFDRLN